MSSCDDEENYLESLRKRFKMSYDDEGSSSCGLSRTSSENATAEICDRKWTPINTPVTSPVKSPFKIKLSGTPGNSSASHEESVEGSQYSSTSEEREATSDAIDIEDWLPHGYVKNGNITAALDDELLAELTDTDRAMFRLRDQGLTWVEVSTAIEEETGEKHHPTTIGRRCGRLCRELYKWESIDEHSLKLAANEVQAEFDAFIKNIRENKWSIISQKMAIHGGATFPLFALQTKYNDVMKRGSVADKTAGIGDKDGSGPMEEDGSAREHLSVVGEVDDDETSSTVASSVADVTAGSGDKDGTGPMEEDGSTREHLSVVGEVDDDDETSSTTTSSVEDEDMAEASESVGSEVGEDDDMAEATDSVASEDGEDEVEKDHVAEAPTSDA